MTATVATVITHAYNESYLLRWWLPHHRDIFSHGIIIDYASTDDTVAICRELAPDWEVRSSRNSDFNAAACDAEVIDIERSLPAGEFKMALTATEFFHCNDLPALLDDIASQGMHGARIRPVAIVDIQERTDISTDVPLTEQCHTGFIGGYMEPYKSRVLHDHPDGAYSIGRHYSGHQDLVEYPDDALLLWYGYAPWTSATRSRKLQIQNRIPESDKASGFGAQHIITEEQLHDMWQKNVALSGDLQQIPEYIAAIK